MAPKGDEETGSPQKEPLLNTPPPKDNDTSPGDMKDAAFWLFMLFLASVTMTVGNKVSGSFIVALVLYFLIRNINRETREID